MKPIQVKKYREINDVAWKIYHANSLIKYIQKNNGYYDQYATREALINLHNKLNIVVLNEVRRHVLPLRIFTDRTMSRR